jgi:hypothetical protein
MKFVRRVLLATVLVAGVSTAGGLVGPVEAALVTQLDFTSGAVNWDGKYGRMLDRLFDQAGTIKLGEYQSMSEIVDPISRGQKSFGLFTSGVFGAPAPSVTIDGMSITVDLSSMFFGWRRGDELRAWNIGGTASGLFNPETSEFLLSWDRVFDNKEFEKGKGGRRGDNIGTFFLRGTAADGPAAVIPLPAAGLLYGTGLFGLGSYAWLKRRRQTVEAT